MLNPLPLSLTLLGAVLLTLPQPVDPDPIAHLNECVQRRFLGIRQFGMSRVSPMMANGVDAISHFQPDTAAEQAAVAELTKKGYQVAWFLAGRHVLDTPPPLATSTSVGPQSPAERIAWLPAPVLSVRYGLQGPVDMANMTSAAILPDRDTLLAETRKAMKAFVGHTRDQGYDVRMGDWTAALRPLHATSETCVQCHTVGPSTLIQDGSHRPEFGDALGVAMYVYRPSRHLPSRAR